LKFQILWQVPVIEDLKSFVLASPGYHRAYLLVRHEILGWHANQQLGGELGLAEVLTAIQSKGIHFTADRESAIALLVKRDRMLEAARSVRAGRMGQKDEGKQHPN